MSLLDRIAKLDSAMQRGLDNSFAFVFGGRVVPAEIEEMLKQESEDNLVHTYEGGVEAPNVFRVQVSTKDLVNLREQSPNLPGNFADQIARFHRNQGWLTPGPVVVVVEEDTSMRTGQLRAHSTVDPAPLWDSGFSGAESAEPAEPTGPEEPTEHTELSKPAKQPELADAPAAKAVPSVNPALVEPALGGQQPEGVSVQEPAVNDPSTEYFANPAEPAEAAAATPAAGTTAGAQQTVNLLLQDGSSRTYTVHEGSNIIGRAHEVDLRLPDTGVSREHAEITWNGQDAVLTDLHSTNGTMVNDMAVDNWLLADGDIITIGHSHIEVRITNTNYQAKN